MTSTERFRLRTLGRLALIDAAGHEEPSLATRPRKLAVLTWLALRPERRATRDRIVGVFWGGRHEERARNSLSDALSHLRRTLGREAIPSQGDEVVLAAEARLGVDALELAAASASGHHDRVVALYEGPFLDGVYVDDAPEFDDWRDRARARLATLFAKSAHARCIELAQSRRWDECRGLAERWLEAELASTDAALFLLNAIKAPDTHGARVAMLAAYDVLVRRLERDLGVPPHATVTALARDVAAQVAQEPAVEPSLAIALAPRVGGVDAVQAADGVKTQSIAPHRAYIAAIASVVVIIVGSALALTRQTAQALDPRRVVVAPFENRTGDSALAPLGRIAADWITRGLIESRTVEVVDPPATEAGSRSDPRAVGREAAAGTVVVGAYFSHGDSVGFEARVVSARDGRVVRAVEAALAPRAEALRAASILRERVVGALAAEFDRVLTGLARESSQPPTYEAYRAWVEGLDLYARREFLRSVPLFLQAAALDSSFVVPLVWAAAAYGNVGDYAHCDSLSRVADTERNRLTAHDRGLLDLWMANLRGDRLGRYDAARAMLAAAPASELALFIAGAAAIGVNRPAEAIRYLRRIPVDRSAVTWDLYGTRLGFALHQAGRYDEELVEARRRRQRQPVWIRAMEDEARALVALGRLREADRVMAEVATAQDQSGRRAGDAMYATALEMKWHGHSREANVLFGRAAEWARTRAVTDGGLTVTQYLLARSLYASGNLAAADSLFGVLAAQQSHSVAYLIGLGLTAAGRGDRARALRLSETLATLDQPYLFGANTVGRARIAALLGQRDEAVGLLRQAMSEGAHIEDVHLWTELQPLRGFPPFDALVAPTG